MGYIDTIEECCRYIEENLNKELSAVELAKKYHYSYYHFCRIFQVLKDVSVAEYIRNRRLEAAVEKIHGGMSFLEAALEVGFETPGGFSKAFKRKYGCSPTVFFQNEKRRYEAKMREPKIVEMSPVYVVGHQRVSDVKEPGIESGAYWYQEQGGHGHGHMKRDDVKIGLWLKEPDADGNLPYFFGKKTDADTAVQEGLIKVTIPEGTYAVFTTEPLDITAKNDHQAFVKRIRDTWKFIFGEWLENSGYVLDEQGYDFEYYDIRCTDKKACCMDIYVSVKKV